MFYIYLRLQISRLLLLLKPLDCMKQSAASRLFKLLTTKEGLTPIGKAMALYPMIPRYSHIALSLSSPFITEAKTTERACHLEIERDKDHNLRLANLIAFNLDPNLI